MTKKNLKIALIFCFILAITGHEALAVNWLEITTPKGKTAYIDTDSITKKDKYYFYNIKYKEEHRKTYKILTVQSGLRNSFSARLKLYDENEYEKLKGDYDNITNLMTENLEAPEFGSIIQSCHKKVKELSQEKNIPYITLD